MVTGDHAAAARTIGAALDLRWHPRLPLAADVSAILLGSDADELVINALFQNPRNSSQGSDVW
jgi:hypothetical protein